MSSLSEQELRSIREELAAGGTPTVWFTSSAVGVPEGRSGKVISLGEPAEGDFIQVRPASTKDVLSFSAAEVTQVKPARKRSTNTKTTAAAVSAGNSTTARAEAVPPTTASGSSRTSGAPSSDGGAGATTSGGRKSNGSASSTSASTTNTGAGKQSARSPSANKVTTDAESAGKAPPGKRTTRPVAGATVTLTADAAGQWTVEVLTGKKRSVRPTQVSANAVAEAAKALHEDVAAAVEPLIDAAREQQRARVEQLRAELASAEQALGELDR